MTDVLYWASRTALVAAWLAAGWLAWRGGRGGLAAAAVLFASVRAWPWNYALLEAARAALRTLGVYGERDLVRGALAALLLVAIAAAGRAAWCRSGRLALVGALLQGLLLAVETCSLDEFLPATPFRQPWRYLLEGSFAALVLAGLRRRGGP